MNEGNSGLQSLIQGGLIGAALGALLTKDKEDGAVVGALVGAAINATLKANETARNSNVPVYTVEKGVLYEISPNGNKRFIKNIKKPRVKFPDSFKLK